MSNISISDICPKQIQWSNIDSLAQQSIQPMTFYDQFKLDNTICKFYIHVNMPIFGYTLKYLYWSGSHIKAYIHT